VAITQVPVKHEIGQRVLVFDLMKVLEGAHEKRIDVKHAADFSAQLSEPSSEKQLYFCRRALNNRFDLNSHD
jgi:hypothetical protein